MGILIRHNPVGIRQVEAAYVTLVNLLPVGRPAAAGIVRLIDQHIKNKKTDPSRNSRIRYVEGRPVKGLDIPLDEVDDLTVAHTVDEIADCTSGNERKRHNQQTLVGLSDQEGDDYNSHDRHRGEEEAPEYLW